MSGFINQDKCFETCAVTLLKCFTIQLWQYGLPCKVPLLTAPTIPSLWRISNPYEWTLDWDGRQIVRPSSTISGTQLVTKLCGFFSETTYDEEFQKKNPRSWDPASFFSLKALNFWKYFMYVPVNEVWWNVTMSFAVV